MVPEASVRFDVHLHQSRYWPDQPHTFYRPDLDFSVRGLLKEMDEQRIGGGLLLPEEHAPTVEETLREGEEAFRASGGRLLRVSTVDPTRGEAEVRHALELWEKTPGLSALKFYPGYQHFYPHDKRLVPVYEFAARRHLVVMFHQGDTLDPNGLVKFARPIEVDEVAVAFREVPFVICHFGNPWIDEASEVVYKNENVYADTSGLFWPPSSPYYAGMIAHARRRIEAAIAASGRCDRILYGSDWPLEPLDLAVGLVEEMGLPPEDRAQILGGNARRLFARALRAAGAEAADAPAGRPGQRGLSADRG
jgi:predicted TIM-barrel fold metal-dependent hydrolase